MQCPQCGNPMAPDAQFCGNCGATMMQTYNAPPQAYQPQQQMYQNPNTQPLGVGDYMLMFILLALPLINLIMLFVWAFGNGNLNRKNYAKAALVFMIIGVVLSVIFAGTMSAFIMQMMDSGAYY